MNSLKELKELVKKKGYGTYQHSNINGDCIYLSTGAREIFLGNEDAEQQLINIVSRFQNGDFGDASEHGKEERKGHEYGRYDLALVQNDEGEDGAVWIHRTEDALIVFFCFER